MNKLSSPALGLTVAVALATGALLLKHPSPKGQAPGAYSDILIVEDNSQRAAPAGEKAAVPTDNSQSGAESQESGSESQKMTGTNSSAQGSQGDTNKGNPPRTPE